MLEASHTTPHNRLIVSVATAVCALLSNIINNKNNGLSDVIRLWRAVPRLHAVCSTELVHSLLVAEHELG